MFKDTFGVDARTHQTETHCLYGHRIVEQCYLCPEGSNYPDDSITLGNHCIDKWGVEASIRGKGVKAKCENCGAIVHESGIKRHQQTNKQL